MAVDVKQALGGDGWWRSRPRGRLSREVLYCDSSALLKLYLSEPGSDELNWIVEGRVDLLVSDLAVSEIVSALARRLRQGALTGEDARRVQHAILAGIAGARTRPST